MKQSSNPSYKTFCEDGAKNGSCSRTKSSSIKKQVIILTTKTDERETGENETGNWQSNKAPVTSKVVENGESTERRNDLRGSTSQKYESRNVIGKGEINVPKGGPVAEIEETHIIERKIVKSKGHQEKQNIVNEAEDIAEKAGNFSSKEARLITRSKFL